MRPMNRSTDPSTVVLSNNKVDFESFPPGFKFHPSDEELVLCYLMKKVKNERLPPNEIVEVNLYEQNPEFYADRYQCYGEKEWYFFTPRERKYKNGTRPRRSAGDGYWKATGADKQVVSEGGQVLGLRKALVFYRGKPPMGEKTNWIMHEFRLMQQPPRQKSHSDDMRLDDYVLCRIYKKSGSSTKTEHRDLENHQRDEEVVSDNIVEGEELPSTHHHVPTGPISACHEACGITDSSNPLERSSKVARYANQNQPVPETTTFHPFSNMPVGGIMGPLLSNMPPTLYTQQHNYQNQEYITRDEFYRIMGSMNYTPSFPPKRPF